jgi:hypothetical protein
MTVSTFRLYVLRATYLMISIFLLTQIWPALVRHAGEAPVMPNVARCLLAAMAPLVLLGLRYPLKMMPILFFELTWKTIWVVAFGLPLLSAHQMDPNTWETFKACLFGVVLLPIIIPWGYTITTYVKPRGDRWAPAA